MLVLWGQRRCEVVSIAWLLTREGIQFLRSWSWQRSLILRHWLKRWLIDSWCKLQKGQILDRMILRLASISLTLMIWWRSCQRNIWSFGGMSRPQIHLNSHFVALEGRLWASQADLIVKEPEEVVPQIISSNKGEWGTGIPFKCCIICWGSNTFSLLRFRE